MQTSDLSTATVGAEPTKGQEPESPTGVKDAGTESSPEVVVDKDGKPLPWNEQPKWKSARAAEKKLDALLKANGLEDSDDLEDLVKSGKVVKGKLADLNAIDDIIAKAAKLDSYEAYWADQAENQRKAGTDPNTRAEEAERELKNERNQRKVEAQQKAQTESTKTAINNYEREVTNLIKEVGLPKDQEGFIAEMFGVNNPSNDVDIMDRKAIKRLVSDGVKRYESFKQLIIADYLKGKTNIVKTGKGEGSTVQDTAPKINLKEARKLAGEQITNMFHGG